MPPGGLLKMCLKGPSPLILCSILQFLDILGFGLVKSHDKWKSYGHFSVFPIFEHSLSIYRVLSKENIILCSIPDLVKSHEKWASYVIFLFFQFFITFHQIFRVLLQEKLYSLLNSLHFRLWMGEITCKMRELWSFFCLSDFHQIFRVCPRRNLIHSSILDILSFRSMELHEKWMSYGWFSVSNFWALSINFSGFCPKETQFSPQFWTFQTLDQWNRMKNERVMVTFLFFNFWALSIKFLGFA